MPRLFVAAATLIAVVVLSGCAASVKYAPRVAGFQPGYVEQRLGDDTYQVRIGEAWPKDWPDLEKFAMFRAAEITKSRGDRYFKVLNASSRVNNYAITSPGYASTTGTAFSNRGNTVISATTVVTPPQTATLQGGWYSLDFRVYTEGQAPAGEPIVDADQIIRDLRYFIDSRR